VDSTFLYSNNHSVRSVMRSAFVSAFMLVASM
jgi:hypothetical protein